MDMCKLPDGLHELCADISMEVIRTQPDDIYCFIANYLDMLMITRENTKVATKVVQDIVLNSEQIVDVLASSGLEIKEIAAAAPHLQEAFRTYLMTVDASKKECDCEDDNDEDEKSQLKICRILKENGIASKKAKSTAKKIQGIFKGHYEQLLLAEQRGEIQWQRATMKTKHILIKMGITEAVASRAALIIQMAFRKYNSRKSTILDRSKGSNQDFCTWLNMMFENTGLTFNKANEAASTIQKAFKRYRNSKLGHINNNISPSQSKNKLEAININETSIANDTFEEIKNDKKDDQHEVTSKSTEMFEKTVNSKIQNEENGIINEFDERVEQIIEPQIENQEGETKATETEEKEIESRKKDENDDINNESSGKNEDNLESKIDNEENDLKSEAHGKVDEPATTNVET